MEIESLLRIEPSPKSLFDVKLLRKQLVTACQRVAGVSVEPTRQSFGSGKRHLVPRQPINNPIAETMIRSAIFWGHVFVEGTEENEHVVAVGAKKFY